MVVQALKLAGKRFVIVEEREFRRLQRRAGIAAESLDRIEKGKLTPTIATLQKIDRAMEQAEKTQAVDDAKQ